MDETDPAMKNNMTRLLLTILTLLALATPFRRRTGRRPSRMRT